MQEHDESEQLFSYSSQTESVHYGSVEKEQDSDEKVKLVPNNGKKLPQYIAALAATLGAFATGATLGFTSPTELDYKEKASIGVNVTDADFKWVGSLTPLGCLVMSIPAGFLLDYIGRKMTMLTMVTVFTVGWALIIWADTAAMLMAGRFITGMACGSYCIALPLYITEFAQKDIRGTLGTYFKLLITGGILFVYVVGAIAGAQLVAKICSILPFIFGIVFVFMPESPMFVLTKISEEKARENLQWFRGKGYNIDDEISDMKKKLAEDMKNPLSIRDSLRKPATKKGLLISFGLMFFLQFSGISAVIFYSSSIFKHAGSSIPSKEASIIIGAVQFVATFVTSLIIDRVGRRILLIISSGVMGICLFFLGLFFRLKDYNLISTEEINKIDFLPILSLSVYLSAYSLGFGPIPWLINPEVLPREIKTKAVSAAAMFNWFLAFLVTLFYVDARCAVGGDITFFVFMVVCFAGVLFIFFLVPETKNKSFDQIQRELGDAN